MKQNSIITKIGVSKGDDYKWYFIVKRPRCPLINSIMFEGMTHQYGKNRPIDSILDNFIFTDGCWYGDENSEDKKREEIAVKLKKDESFLLKVMNSAYGEWRIFEKFCRKVKKINFSKVDNLKIKEDFDKIIGFLLGWEGMFLQFMWLPEKMFEKKIKDLLEKKLSQNPQADFLLLTSPAKDGFFEKESRRLMRLAAEIQQDKNLLKLFSKDSAAIAGELKKYPQLRNRLIRHLEEFSWLANTSFNSTFWSLSDIIKRIKNLLGSDVKAKLKELEKNKKEREEKIGKLIKRLRPNKKEAYLIATTRELVYFRSFRTDIQWKTGYYAYPLFREIARRMGVAIGDFHYLAYFEIADFLSGGSLDKSIITKRKNGYAVKIEHRKINYYYGKKEIDEIKALLGIREEREVKVLKGNTTSPGIACGAAKIIHGIKDLSKIKNGDILVASMTKPDYITAMEKAAAFITDEGGILCHAAIISREMKKPCIIGTKIATKVLHDGDLVEVNANKGVVKILNKK